jgi:hypothetical protein
MFVACTVCLLLLQLGTMGVRSPPKAHPVTMSLKVGTMTVSLSLQMRAVDVPRLAVRSARGRTGRRSSESPDQSHNPCVLGNASNQLFGPFLYRCGCIGGAADIEKPFKP